MVVGGLQRFSLIDYPGLPSAVVFTQGCNFACRFCHNPELVDPHRFAKPIALEEILAFLEKRKTQLKGVTVTGGEPTIHEDLGDFLAVLKSMGYAIKLDTNGSRPAALESLYDRGLIDFIAMDVKAPLGAYKGIAGCDVCTSDIEDSIRLIISMGTSHEFRTTILEQALSLEDALEIGRLVRGCARYVIQPFVPSKTIDKTLLALPKTREETLTEIQGALVGTGIPCVIR